MYEYGLFFIIKRIGENMKKIICLLVVCAAFAGSIFAAETSDAQNDQQKTMEKIIVINHLITDGLEKNKAAIMVASQDLTLAEKYMVIDSNKKSAGVPFVCNWLLGFGIGSFIQHDTTVATGILGGELAGWALYFNGVSNLNTSTMTTGLLIYGGFQIFALIRPWVYTDRYNTTLKSALGADLPAVSFAPIVSLDNTYGIACKIAM
jgi:hypothetical protein